MNTQAFHYYFVDYLMLYISHLFYNACFIIFQAYCN